MTILCFLFLWSISPQTATAAPPRKTNAITASKQYRSPKNATRRYRKSTRYIILHTTEGAAKGSLEKVSKNGECHYLVDKNGKVYQIIDRGRTAYHAGLSMWQGRTGLDSCSIGIEIVGYHNKKLTTAQETALKKLISELKSIYRLTDDAVLTHSMVAYGSPNHWHKYRHRGRKRCGMLLALPANRARLGLYSKPTFDPDVRAGRLRNADPELAKLLYTNTPVKKPSTAGKKTASGKTSVKPAVEKELLPTPSSNIIGPKLSAWDIARDQYNSASTIYTFPNGVRKTGAEITKWKAIPAGTRVELGTPASENANEGLLTIGEDGTAHELLGDAIALSSTFYFPPKGRYLVGSTLTLEKIENLPKGTRALMGYKVVGPITAKNPVFNLCGTKWNRSDTYYWTTSGKILSGEDISEKSIPAGAMVFTRQ